MNEVQDKRKAYSAKKYKGLNNIPLKEGFRGRLVHFQE